ncbi:MAG TPA: helix-turn-helix transcriptional regulator [Sulfuricella sp.]|nr:helix-turn-helix transcriptional regulator [Sulfuricella sp.]
MPSTESFHERTHALWDELADFEASQADEALHHLMKRLCELVGAQNACWVGAVRLSGDFSGDPVKGWRPRVVRFLHPSPLLDEGVREQMAKLEQGVADITTIRNAEGAGIFRANRLRDIVAPEWFETPYYQAYYRDLGKADAIWVSFPINEDAESLFGIYSTLDRPPFTEAERDISAYTLRGIKWFHRQIMLSHCLLVAGSPLTPVERQVLHGLLSGLTEKEIAIAQNQSYHTTHEYVSAIYRKFGVNNRATLMALWLGKAS